MDDKGYAFTPLAFLLMVPVVLVAVSFGGIVDELNTLSAILIGGDVTATIAHDLVDTIKLDMVGAARGSSLIAVETVVNKTNLESDNNPFFAKTGTNTSKAFILANTVNTLNINITQTCRVLENETGRSIYVKIGDDYVYINPNDTAPVNIFQTGNMSITQSDPFGFNITSPSLSIRIVQNSETNSQSVDLNLPAANYYVSIEGLEDPYIWVNTKERNSSLIYAYPYTSSDYHFDDNVTGNVVVNTATGGKLDNLWGEIMGAPNATVMHPYYFQDPRGLTFFDRLENRNTGNSYGPDNAKMSTFILWDPLEEDHGQKASMLDRDYFANVKGFPITVQKGKNGALQSVICPNGDIFLASNNSIGQLGLQWNYIY